VALRQLLDLYSCERPVRYFKGVPSPCASLKKWTCSSFRENTEDVYIGIEWKFRLSRSKEAPGIPEQRHAERWKEANSLGFRRGHQADFTDRNEAAGPPRDQIRSGKQKEERDAGAQGQYPKFTEGGFRDWGYELARENSVARQSPERESWIIDNLDKNPALTVEQNAAMIEPDWNKAPDAFKKTVYAEVKQVLDSIYATHGTGQWKQKLMINDRIADSVFQQVLMPRDEYSVLATSNLNGDYLSDACAAQVGGLGMAPGFKILENGFWCFRSYARYAPKYADKDVINPSSVMLSGAMMLSSLAGRKPPR